VDLFGFASVEGRRVEAGFDGGTISSDAGAVLLGATDRAVGLVERFAGCFRDGRRADLVEHEVRTLVGQRVFGLALGYEDLNDHDWLRHDPVMAVLVGKLAGRRRDCAAAAGKSTLNRLELSRPEATRYHKISHDPAAIEALLVDIFLEAHAEAPEEMVLDLDATDAGSSTATTAATATCRSTCSAAVICWRPSCGVPTSTARPARSKRLTASSGRFVPAGPRSGSCCAPTQALPARP
jgi:hypothetical protein